MPYADKENRRLYDERRRASREPRKFVGVDGEGGAYLAGDGRHTYSLLRCGYEYIYDPSGLTAIECLRFMHQYGVENPDQIMVSYFFDYDVTMILKDVGKSTVDYLLNRGGGLWHFAKYHDFQIDYIPGKRFAIKHNGKMVVIHDCSGFFQSAFLKAIELWDIPTDAQYEQIETGKLARAGFSSVMGDDEIGYNRLECILLARLMEEFRLVCDELGLSVRNWEGAGNVATALLTKFHTPKNEEHNVTKEIARFCRNAYYGGRFEILEAGNHEQVWELDIASAYPSTMDRLPCLRHSRWVKFEGCPSEGTIYCSYLEYESSGLWGPFPCRRKDGSIYFPLSGKGWYWSPEVEMAKEALGTSVTHIRGYYCEEKCECIQFDWVPGLYRERLNLGKNGKGIVLKLGLNSLYGKFAQSIGAPRFASPIWAGLITSFTRAQLLGVFKYHPHTEVLMFATDAVYVTVPPSFPVTTTKELGAFEAGEPHSMFICKPGFYFMNDDPTVKSRGLSSRYLTDSMKRFKDAWDTDGYSGSVVIEGISTFIGLRMSRQLAERPRLIMEAGFDQSEESYDAGRWVTRSMRLRFDPTSKRKIVAGSRQTVPYPYSHRTIPYSKTMGVQDDLIYTHPEDNNVLRGLPEV